MRPDVQTTVTNLAPLPIKEWRWALACSIVADSPGACAAHQGAREHGGADGWAIVRWPACGDCVAHASGSRCPYRTTSLERQRFHVTGHSVMVAPSRFSACVFFRGSRANFRLSRGMSALCQSGRSAWGEKALVMVSSGRGDRDETSPPIIPQPGNLRRCAFDPATRRVGARLSDAPSTFARRLCRGRST